MDWIWEQTRDEMTAAYEGLVSFVIHGVEALLIVVLAVALSRALRRRVQRSRFTMRLGPNLTALFANAVAIGAYILAATFILGLFGANWTALLAFLSVSTVAISLSFQDVLKNFIAGVYILLERPFSIGERIQVRDFDGLVESIDIRTTVLRNDREEHIIVPNAVMFTEILTNRSASSLHRDTVLLEGVKASPENIEQMIHAALAGLDLIEQKKPSIAWRGLGEDGASVSIDIWHPAHAPATPEVLARLRQAFPHASVTTGDA
ncbi:MAG: mechanosensitive ion channel family protein [Thermomicrobiales bacterium]